MTIKTILVPYDASSYAEKAYKKALEIAEKFSAKIIVVSVVAGQYNSTIGFTTKLDRQILEDQNNFAAKLIRNLKQQAEKRGIKFEFKLIVGNYVAKEIIKFAESVRPDLIVIGSHGRTGFRKIILGSVAYSIVQNAKTAVMVVK